MSGGNASVFYPQLLRIKSGGLSHWGGSQLWYSTVWQRQAGCGPTACSHLLWYIAQTRESCGKLCDWDAACRTGFRKLMDETWHYVTPGKMGVNSTALFVAGAVRYGAEHDVPLRAHALDIPALHSRRPQYKSVKSFLIMAFEKDLPVAFLNLSNGSLDNLESWHWVTLIALDGEHGTILDQGEKKSIDLELWLRSTVMGGGLVCLEPA